MFKKDFSYLSGIILIFAFFWMLLTGLIQLRFELHRFIYHIYGVYCVIILSVIHLCANWKKTSGFIKRKIHLREEVAKGLQKGDIQSILSLALIFSLVVTLASGFLQVKLNFPRSRFVYHIYGAGLTLALALVHLCVHARKLNGYLKTKSPAFLLSPNRRCWSYSFKRVTALGAGLLIAAAVLLAVKWPLFQGQIAKSATVQQQAPIKEEVAMEYHETTKHTYAELVRRTGGLNWSRQPSVFKKYPRAELIKLSTNQDFDSISVGEAIEAKPFMGSFSSKPITELELSRLLYYTDGITKVLHYPGLTYYLRAAPSAGALYPTVIYLVVNNVEGLKQGIYHYSVRDNALHFLKEGDYLAKLASGVQNPSRMKNASLVVVMTTIFYRTKWKYRERGYRYTLLDTGHVGRNLTLTANALGLGWYSVGTFLDNRVNQMLGIDGVKEAAVSLHAVGKMGAQKDKVIAKELTLFKKRQLGKFPENLTIAEIVHESGKYDSVKVREDKGSQGREFFYKSYPEAKKLYLPKEFSKEGLSLDEAIRKRRSARDYSGGPISNLELSRLLYYAYGVTKGDAALGRAVDSVEDLYPIEMYVVINNVEGIARGIYHYNVLEHALEFLKEGDYRRRIASACLGQQLVGNANVAFIMTAIFDRASAYGDRGYRYIHLDAGAIGENLYLESISMGLGVCGIGAFFDDQINGLLGIDGIKESVLYVTSVGRLSK